MPSHAFSSLVLRELITEIRQGGEQVSLEDEHWAEELASTCRLALQEDPVVYLPLEDYFRARWFVDRYKAYDLNVADRATHLIRDKHAAEIRDFLRSKSLPMEVNPYGNPEDTPYPLPRSDRAPTSFKEWFAVNSVWRLILVMVEVSFQDAAFGTSGCLLRSLPKSWEAKLDECLQITDVSAVIPALRHYGLPLMRGDLNSILPTSDSETGLSGVPNSAIIDRWFQILISYRELKMPGTALFYHPDSLDVAGTTPQEVAEKVELVNADITMILFPTVVKEEDHCILVTAFPQKQVVVVFDSLGPMSSTALQKNCPWIKETGPETEKGIWRVLWLDSPQQGEEDACGVFMLINALIVICEKEPHLCYAREDTLFLRRFIAAVICMGELPEPL